jgi:hypothetical protein
VILQSYVISSAMVSMVCSFGNLEFLSALIYLRVCSMSGSQVINGKDKDQ